ncbi:5969_t:CDS:2 [Ambispora gerdemannii]|uniref:5969_t:CDS:1 n=1 Tax=Ambispora gerdemannii TaxID=144530 RepID=A0A9N9A2U8_9GLOM|nr:5969_t:CDS:2 [Ambispora gerdemannii]
MFMEELDGSLEMDLTQNIVEGWHHQWNVLIGKAHVGVYTIIEEMRKEQQQIHK